MKTLGSMLYSQFKSLLGEGVFNADGTPLPSATLTLLDWSWLNRGHVEVGYIYCYTKTFNPNSKPPRFHRAMTRPFFTRERISDFDIYDKNCATTLKLARTRLAEGYPVEFQVDFSSHECILVLSRLLCVGSSCSVHPGLCYRILIWKWCWIAVSGHFLSTISGTSKQTFILQPSLHHICQSIFRRTKSNCWTLIPR